MLSPTRTDRATLMSFGAIGLLSGLPLCTIMVFVLLLPSDHAAGNIAASVLLALVPTGLTAVSAALLLRFTRTKSPGFLHGILSTLLGFLLFFVALGVWRGDVAGLFATGLHLLFTVKLLWAFLAAAGITGFTLGRRLRRKNP